MLIVEEISLIIVAYLFIYMACVLKWLLCLDFLCGIRKCSADNISLSMIIDITEGKQKIIGAYFKRFQDMKSVHQ